MLWESEWQQEIKLAGVQMMMGGMMRIRTLLAKHSCGAELVGLL